MLSLAHLTVLDANPLELIDAAAGGGFAYIGLRLAPPPATDAWPDIVGDTDLIRRIEQRLAETGIRILDVESFWLAPETSVHELLRVLETAARLGARYLLVVGNDPEPTRLGQTFGGLCEAAAPLGLKAMLEFIPFSHTRTVQAALRIVEHAGQPNAGVLVDALHVSRSGGSPEDLRRVDPALLDYWQICDAPAAAPPPDGLRAEARTQRLLPGDGGLPLRQLLEVMPPGRPIGVEVPSAQLAHLSPLERGRLCGQATRAFLEQVAE